MKKMNTKQKISWNKLTAKRTRKNLKRRPHVRALKLADRKINIARKRVEKMLYYRRKYGNQPVSSDGPLL